MGVQNDIRSLPPNRPIVLRNINCPYCGGVFSPEVPPTSEHVVGRRFVPKGTFDRQWNLIVKACKPCNSAKAELEDDISAITMLPDLHGRYASDDPRLIAEAVRKAGRSMSRRTGKPVAESREELVMRGSWGPAAVTFNMVVPPQIDENRIYRLAQCHVNGFFFFNTYREDTARGGFPLGTYRFLTFVRRGDWGNPQMRWFMDMAQGWDMRVAAVAADGFFRIIIRRNLSEPAVWAWAVEWNRDTRVIGFVGDPAQIDDLLREVPRLSIDQHRTGPDEWFGVRVEEALAPEEDHLFVVRHAAQSPGSQVV